MRSLRLVCCAVLVMGWAGSVRAAATGFEATAPARPELVSGLALQASTITGYDDVKRKPKTPKKPKSPHAAEEDESAPLGAERARILLRSLTIPGWGQATLGHRRSATVFGITELGAWTAFTAFRLQQSMREGSFERTARLFAGIDLRGRDEEYLRNVGNYLSSSEYNLFVVSRDAANLYLTDPNQPDMDGYRAYIAAHSIGGADAWSWSDIESILRYRAQRKDAQRAGLRANTALAVAVANRLVSALHAARIAGHPGEPGTSLRLQVSPHPDDPAGFRAGLHADF